MPRKDAVIQIRIASELKARVQRVAQAQERSASFVIVKAIEAYVKQFEQQEFDHAKG